MHNLTDRERYKDKVLKKNSLFRSIRMLESREVRSYNSELLKNKKINYEDSLSNEQKRALCAIDGQYLVIAGAGSGKTRTIVYRTALLLELGVDPKNILMITFTKKAAMEMKERVEELLNKSIKDLDISTFHSFCGRMLLKYNTYFGIDKLKILEEKEKVFIIKSLILKYHIKRVKQIPFPNEKRIIELLNKEKIKKTDINLLMTEKEKVYIEELMSIKREFIDIKNKNKVFEFDDLLELFTIGMERSDDFKKIINDQYKYVIVDEYQDSNQDQRRLLIDLVGDNGNLMVVGDDYQSIYGFRGGNFENILRFYEDFPKSKLIKLEKNYRSTDEIIDYCNRIARMFEVSYSKNATGTGKTNRAPIIKSFKDTKSEGIYVANKVKELIDSGISMNEIAILYRNRFVAIHILKALDEIGIKYFIKNINNIDNDEPDDLNERISLYSVHSSKGLEWDHVFMPTMLDGLFPSSIDKEQLEEEKRLYYVGCSRAKKFLYLTYPDYFYEKTGFFNRRSQFLNY